MKKILLCLLLFIFYMQSFSQQTFSDTIKSSGSRIAAKTIVASNGDLLAPLSIDSGVYVFRVNKCNKLLWEKVYGSISYWTPIICATKDNGFVCFCDVLNSITSTHNITLIKCDSLGNIQWSRSIAPDYKNNYIYPGQIITNAQQDYIITYKSDSKIFPYPEAFQLLKFNKSGNLIFQTGYKNLFDRNYESLILNSITETYSGGYLIGFSYAEAETDARKGYFLLTDKDGNLVSYKSFGPHHIDNNDEDYQISVFENDGLYYVLGYYLHSFIDETEYYYVTSFRSNDLSANGKFIPYNTFALQRFVRENKIHVKQLDKYAIDKNSIIFLNLLTDINSPTVFSFNKYDSLGRVCPNYTLPVYNYDTSSIVVYLGEEKKGAIKSLDTIELIANAVLQKNIQLLKYVCTGNSVVTAKSNKIQNALSSSTGAILFPNPARNTITISIPSLNKQTQINLFNSNGQLLQSFSAYTNTNKYIKTINIASYPKGIYVVKISTTNQIQILKFIKQ